jgi:hypothetical protein
MGPALGGQFGFSYDVAVFSLIERWVIVWPLAGLDIASHRPCPRASNIIDDQI